MVLAYLMQRIPLLVKWAKRKVFPEETHRIEFEDSEYVFSWIDSMQPDKILEIRRCWKNSNEDTIMRRTSRAEGTTVILTKLFASEALETQSDACSKEAPCLPISSIPDMVKI